MECNKEEARRALAIADRKLSENDYNGAQKFASKAQKMYPKLDGLKQVLAITHVYICGSNGGDESDWYGILGVDPLAVEETLKRQYKRLALLLHPDKNRFHGAEGAFKMVSDAWRLLSDKDKRSEYDRKRRRDEIPQEKSRRPKNKPASSDGANQEAQEKIKEWLEKARKDTAAAFASARPQNEPPSSSPTSSSHKRRRDESSRKRRRDEIPQKRSKRPKNEPASSDGANQEARERFIEWFEKAREDVAAGVAAAKINSQHYY
ncbi:unnamed protein product [Microthlaspi erraticum]|uniref:J domain-containing protein n=1 Tax=Microthlaspi erraticum TaxID=1685480 RepID=A0A6D2J4P5_9BRAS|nr:unnamed protein product [Microthlaspi erraticum]